MKLSSYDSSTEGVPRRSKCLLPWTLLASESASSECRSPLKVLLEAPPRTPWRAVVRCSRLVSLQTSSTVTAMMR